MRARRPVLLVVGESQRPTGHARVLRDLLPGLVDAYDVHQVELHDDGSRVPVPWTVHRADGGGDHHGGDRVRALLPVLRPRLLLALGEPWLAAALEPALEPRPGTGPRPVVVAYAVVEAGEHAAEVAPALRRADVVVAQHDTAARWLRAATGRAVAVVPHAVDAAAFAPYPAGPRRAVRRRLGIPDEAWVVLCANRNTGRKRLDLTLRAFAAFARDRPRARLWLHSGRTDFGTDTVALAESLGIADRVLRTTTGAWHPRLPDGELRALYAACDTGLGTAETEGWGLTAFEHAATGAPQVVPGDPGSRAAWRGAALHVPPGDVVAGAARALAALYDDPRHHAACARRARARATDPTLSPDAVRAAWRGLLRGARPITEEDQWQPTTSGPPAGRRQPVTTTS